MRLIQDKAKGGKSRWRIMADQRLNGEIQYSNGSATIRLGDHEGRLYIVEFGSKDLLWLFGKMPLGLLQRLGERGKEGFIAFFDTFKKEFGGVFDKDSEEKDDHEKD